MTSGAGDSSFPLGLGGKAAIVTGAGAGIGQGAALGLARAGVRVGLVDIDPARAEFTAALIAKEGGEALPLPADVMDTGALTAAIESAHRAWGRLDILVNNAGGVRGRKFLDQSERSWRRHIDINLVSMLAATSAAAPLMTEGGSIVNVTSIEGLRAAPTFAVYAACKAGMISFTKTMAVELGERGIRVNAIAPDHTATPGLRGVRSGPADPDDLPPRPLAQQEAVQRYVPLAREGVVAECADAIVFLCSDRASYVTGVTLSVDGGAAAASGWVRAGDGWSLYGDGIPLSQA
jgi:NAD(P)-dependent dehydrogenase (short-subunit alcohol dehydrogenase family)